MASVGSGVEATKGFVTKHWVAFIVLGFIIVAAALAYDHKNNGSLSTKIAGLPIIGKLFT